MRKYLALPILALVLLGSCVKDELPEQATPPAEDPYKGLVINELMSSNKVNPIWFPNGTEGFDWVELYNSGTKTINLSGLYVTDTENGIDTKYQIPEGKTLPAGGYMVLICSDDASLTGEYVHLGMKLSTDEGKDNNIYIYSPQGVLVTTSAAFGFTSGIGSDGHGLDAEKSYGRAQDGGSVWQVFGIPTPGAPNSDLKPGKLVINELMASNDASYADENGEFDDWFEIYNSGDLPVDIGGWYVTDDLATPTKHQIPTGQSEKTTVQPHSWLVIFADKQPDQGPLHANIKLSGSGDELGLSQDGVTFIDQIEFGAGKPVLAPPTDASAGRDSDGADTWVIFQAGVYRTPTPGASNNPLKK